MILVLISESSIGGNNGLDSVAVLVPAESCAGAEEEEEEEAKICRNPIGSTPTIQSNRPLRRNAFIDWTDRVSGVMSATIWKFAFEPLRVGAFTLALPLLGRP